ncbi:MAG: AlpA family transcriptional regulator [Gallionellales bacterium CG_4_8_14_3_um_filter_54_18]|nr:MAG: AlpA family transcriptional regulator [Gallionellales bacterium CG_4_8_14_3_um_filter_54_18]PIY01081.1 MAG: AlpA family transcriptional regulator [Hydrogenophilales bacterium CG_4_10_14_3_um_filter_58_23]PJB06338.1 MAG: AlpA family transcriptional regulator [Hydrogenophilales bacterium CG_4_9_14_3_um_filter_59_35]
MQSNNSQTTRFLRLPQCREIAGGVAPSTIWGWVKNGTFPKPIKLSANCTAWDAAQVEAWAQARIAASSTQAADNAQGGKRG